MKRFVQLTASIVVVIALVAASFSAGYLYGKNTREALPSVRADEELALVRKVIDIVEEEYIEKVDRDKLIQGAAAGVVDSLGDPYSHYLDSKHFEMVEEETRGSYSGIGIYIGMKGEHPVVQSVIDKTPAFRAGLKSGDVILEVDGEATQGKNLDEVASMIRGDEGTQVTLKIGREGGETFEVTIVRESIKIPNVEHKLIDGKYGYVRIRGFNVSTSVDVQNALDELVSQGAEGFIIDLRNNPGGLLDQSIELASLFLESGKVVSVKYRNQPEEVYNVYRVSRNGQELKLFKQPVVVLVNGGTASASEIFSGALKDHGRAVLVGEKTFGKGSVQDVIKLENGDGLLITIAKYYTPSGVSIHEKGIEPDIEVKVEEQFTPGEEDDIQLKKAIEVLEQKISEGN